MFKNATEMRKLTNEPYAFLDALKNDIEDAAKMGKYRIVKNYENISKEAIEYIKDNLGKEGYKVGFMGGEDVYGNVRYEMQISW